MSHIFSETALLPDGWANNVRLSIDPQGRIEAVEKNAASQPGDFVLKDRILLPAPANLHSHGFQRALAGLTETRGENEQDSFWTWRRLMYAFLDHLSPEHLEVINAFAQMEMLEAGYACVAEFHYLHHQPDGSAYDNPGEISHRVAAAAALTGIGLTHLPVYYAQGGVDGRPLQGGQRRFANDIDGFAALWQSAKAAITELPADSEIGFAPHSLRAVSKSDLSDLLERFKSGPVHIHIAEQLAEVAEIEAAYGARPVDWLFDHFAVDQRWCLVHATHLTEGEKQRLAKSSAVAGLCPITEANLGDGIFDAMTNRALGGRIGIGTDSNIAISLVQELRALEYSQRLQNQARSVLSSDAQSTGQTLLDIACAGGAQASGRACGALAIGNWADMMALDAGALELTGLPNDTALDSWIFTSKDQLLSDVWAAGRHMVQQGHHIHREKITSRYRQWMLELRGLF